MLERASRSPLGGPLAALLAADIVSRMGNLLAAMAVPWLVLETTGSVARAGITVFAAGVPVVLALACSGTLIDRHAYRHVSVVADLLSGVTVALLPLLHWLDLLSFPLLLALVFLGALLDLPATLARTAALPGLAEQRGTSTERAFAISEGITTTAQLALPPLAGALIAVAGTPLLLWIDAATFAVAAMLVGLVVHEPPRERPEAASYRAHLVEGLRMIRLDRVLFPFVLLLAALNVVVGPLDALLVPVYARDILGGAFEFGLLTAGLGLGSLAGTALMGWRGDRWQRRPLLAGSVLGLAIVLATLALRPPLVPALVLVAFAGLALGVANIVEYAVYFERIPAAARARVLGLTGAVAWCTVPIGRLLAGVSLDVLGLGTTLLVLALLLLPLPAAVAMLPALRGLERPARG